MNDQPLGESDDDIPDALHAILRQIFGDRADEALEHLRDSGIDLSVLKGLPEMDFGVEQVEAMAARMQAMMSASGEAPVNWELAHTVARQEALSGGDPVITPTEQRGVTEAFDLAELWLDPVVRFGPAATPVRAWSNSEWVEETLPVFTSLFEPIARQVAEALVVTFRDQMPDPADFTSSSDLPFPVPQGLDPSTMVRQMGGAMFGMQVGRAAGTLSKEVFGGTDLGLPLVSVRAMLPRNVAAFAEGLESPETEVRIFLALREAAHARLFAHVPWLRPRLMAAVEQFARGIAVDMSALHEAISEIDLSNPEALGAALSSGVFRPQMTEAQQTALLRLETMLALVEGWVDQVTGEAAAGHLPNATALAEMMRRRRAAGGPAEQTFNALVGLQIRPRRAREAATLWARLADARGIDGRDALWDHPDLLPTSEDLDNPDAFGESDSEDKLGAELDAALAEILGPDDGERHDPAENDPDM